MLRVLFEVLGNRASLGWGQSGVAQLEQREGWVRQPLLEHVERRSGGVQDNLPSPPPSTVVRNVAAQGHEQLPIGSVSSPNTQKQGQSGLKVCHWGVLFVHEVGQVSPLRGPIAQDGVEELIRCGQHCDLHPDLPSRLHRHQHLAATQKAKLLLGPKILVPGRDQPFQNAFKAQVNTPQGLHLG